MVVPNEKILHFVIKRLSFGILKRKINQYCQKGGSMKIIAKAFFVKRRLSTIDRIGK
jgi:hypothetical protein